MQIYVSILIIIIIESHTRLTPDKEFRDNLFNIYKSSWSV